MVLASSVAAAAQPVITFSALGAYSGTGRDASAVINDFLAAAPAHAVVELPPGVYTVRHTIVLPKPLTLTTQGLANAPKPGSTGDGCAEILADPAFEGATGLLYSGQDGDRIDHLVFDGNKSLRTGPNLQRCLDGYGEYGTNLFLMGSFEFTNSVSRNALAGTALVVLCRAHDFKIANNTFAYNGSHSGLIADGLTIHDAVNGQVLDNEFIDGGTDVTLILGGGRDCKVQGNVIRYGPGFSGGSFAALMLHAWPDSSGDYTGADISGNVIDGGPNRRAGFGLLVGSAPWYPSDPYGAFVHDNTITNVQVGLSVDRGSAIRLAHNTVTDSGGLTYTSAGRLVAASAYNISPDSTVDLAGDTDPGKYTHTTMVGAIPNWKSSPEAAVDDGNPDLADTITNLYVHFAGRLPTADERAWWIGLGRDMSLPGIRKVLVGAADPNLNLVPAILAQGFPAADRTAAGQGALESQAPGGDNASSGLASPAAGWGTAVLSGPASGGEGKGSGLSMADGAWGRSGLDGGLLDAWEGLIDESFLSPHPGAIGAS